MKFISIKIIISISLILPVYSNNVAAPKARIIEPCIFQYNSSFIQDGEIFSPNYPNRYPNNLNCRYEFYGRENELVILEPLDFQLESPQGSSNQGINFMDFVETRGNNSNENSREKNNVQKNTNKHGADRQCFYDFIDVFTTNIYGTTIWNSRHCGNTIQERLVSTSPTLFLVFRTDRMLTYKGFKFQFSFSNLNIFPLNTEPECGRTEITGFGGELASPNYPLKYPANTDCAWTITVAKDQNVLIKFVDINLEEACAYSFVKIWDGYVSDVDKPELTVCSQLKFYHKGLKGFQSKSNRVVISFDGNKGNPNEQKFKRSIDSDSSSIFNKLFNKSKNANEGGFRIIWTAVHLREDCNGFRCKGGRYCIDSSDTLCHTNNRYCIDYSQRCNGLLNCDNKDDSDEKFCALAMMNPDLSPMLIIAIIIFISIILACLITRKCKTRKDKEQVMIKQEMIEGILSNKDNKFLEYECDERKISNYDETVSFTPENSNAEQTQRKNHSITSLGPNQIILNEHNAVRKYSDLDLIPPHLSQNQRTNYREKSNSTFKNSRSDDQEHMRYIDNSEKTYTSSLISMEASPKTDDHEMPYASSEKFSTTGSYKPRDNKLITSVSQIEIIHGDNIAKLEDFNEQDEVDTCDIDDGTKSNAIRRNSYTLAIYDND